MNAAELAFAMGMIRDVVPEAEVVVKVGNKCFPIDSVSYDGNGCVSILAEMNVKVN